MKKQHLRPLLLVALLIALTCTALAYATNSGKIQKNTPTATDSTAKNNILTVSSSLTQNKVNLGGDGIVSMALTLASEKISHPDMGNVRNVDMVIVLDRSGSMQGKKIIDAKNAINNLIDSLGDKDRFGLVSYSDGVMRHTALTHASLANRAQFKNAVQGIYADGGTNLGAGLKAGMNLLQQASSTGNLGRVVLISDGHANQGITDPGSLGALAATAVKGEFGVTTVGVGIDFNEQLMTTIADQGTGNYYFMENPASFAEIFQKEFHNTRLAAATGVEVRLSLPQGVSLIDAAGYPIEIKNNQAVFRPGNILSGQTRKLYLTLKVPTANENTYDIKEIEVAYNHQDKAGVVMLETPMTIACVKNKQEVYASINSSEWEEKVLRQDMNRLREQVSNDIRDGRQSAALARIQEYKAAKEDVNAVVGSDSVAESLEQEVSELNNMVNDTFTGDAGEVATKQKLNAKSLQYEGLKGMRSIK